MKLHFALLGLGEDLPQLGFLLGGQVRVDQLGMLAGTIVYVNAGTQLAQIDSLSGILSPGLLFSFALLGVFPLLAKRALAWLQSRRVYAHWKKPARFDRNLVVIGAGAAGLVSAYIAATVKAKVTLVEAHGGGVSLEPGVGDRGLEDLQDRLGRTLGRELQDRHGIRGLLAADEVDDPTGLLRGHPDVARDSASLGDSGFGGHQRRRPFLSSLT